MVEFTKATVRGWLHWRVYLGHVDYYILLISGSENVWGHLLSRWRKPGAEADGGVTGSVELEPAQVRYMAVNACPDADFCSL